MTPAFQSPSCFCSSQFLSVYIYIASTMCDKYLSYIILQNFMNLIAVCEGHYMQLTYVSIGQCTFLHIPITFCHRENLGKRISTDFNVLKYLRIQMRILLYGNFLWTVVILIVLIFKCQLSQVEFVLESFSLIENFLQHFVHTIDSVFTFHAPSLRTV